MPETFSAADSDYMAEAFRLAARGLYSTDPNPRVGSVVVKSGAIVGRGFHRKAGEPHAEVLAMREAGSAAAGATLYITLEPCAHHGRTPPCAGAIVAAKPARVVAAMTDPNPKVAGRGFEIVKQAGIAVASGLMEAQARALNPGFISRMSRGRPWVRSKLAMSLDGRTALADGSSKWISGEAAREDVQHWRARSSAVLTGIGTVLKDDPSLNVRMAGEWRQPARVVVDTYLKMPGRAKLLQLPGETYVATTVSDSHPHQHLLKAGAKILTLPLKDGQVDLAVLLTKLADLECNEVLVEAGPKLNGALLAAGLVDELILYMAPHLLGDSGQGLFHLQPLAAMQERHELEITDLRMFGNDVRLILRPKK
jgi:diaminohydroxyphosphoribosylaminopyrimidine deaminase/5-amino-6-(5-phosphoribosylamino)uracil reductase